MPLPPRAPEDNRDVATAPPRPHTQLLEWRPIGKGAPVELVGKAKIRWHGLEIDDVGLFRREDGARWAQLPAEVMRDADDRPLLNDRGKTRYRSKLRWSTRELQEGFSHVMFELVEVSTGSAAKPPQASAPTPFRARPQQPWQVPQRAEPAPDPPEDSVADLWREPTP